MYICIYIYIYRTLLAGAQVAAAVDGFSVSPAQHKPFPPGIAQVTAAVDGHNINLFLLEASPGKF